MDRGGMRYVFLLPFTFNLHPLPAFYSRLSRYSYYRLNRFSLIPSCLLLIPLMLISMTGRSSSLPPNALGRQNTLAQTRSFARRLQPFSSVSRKREGDTVSGVQTEWRGEQGDSYAYPRWGVGVDE
jgi:hypothetical protein